jgi:hypothetical protein
MAYNKDSGESRLRKDVNPNVYVHKKNRNIFKNSQTTQTSPPPKPQRKTNYDWDIPNVDMDVDVSNIENFELESDVRKTPEQKPRYEKKEPENFHEYERPKKDDSEPKQELLSFGEVIGIIVANGLVPVVGGFVYYIIFSSKGAKQKAAQSIVLSAIVSIIRIMYLVK